MDQAGFDFFVLYGVVAQVVVDSGIKLFYAVKVLDGLPLGAPDWLKLGIPFFLLTALVVCLPLDGLAKLGSACFVGATLMGLELLLFFREEIVRRLGKTRRDA